MTILLDTCAFIWMSTDEGQLSVAAREAIADPANIRLFSAMSVFEMAIKTQIGKLTLHAPLDRLISEGFHSGAIEELPVTIEHAMAVSALPFHHRDPFDRMLIAQARVMNVPIVTRDSAFAAYGVRVIW